VRSVRLCLLGTIILSLSVISAFGQEPGRELCPRPMIGSTVPEPRDLRSEDGILKAEITYRSYRDAHGQTRFCYLDKDGNEAPTLRVNPGDWLILSFKNEAAASHPVGNSKQTAHAMHSGYTGDTQQDATNSQQRSVTVPANLCAIGAMGPATTNLHFHGLAVPATCHQDDVLHTMIQPGNEPFEYRFQIPQDEPPGLYWYHPHVHGSTKAQVLGGASGALIVEGIERAKPDLAGLPERVFVIRDQNLLNPKASPSTTGAPIPPVHLDGDGDVMNTGTGTGKPAEDLSMNFVPVPYPEYPPAVIYMKPGERQLWRVLNASAITYLNLQLLCGGQVQAVSVVAIDGVPLSENGLSRNRAIWQNHLGVPPGGRIEFVMKGPPEATDASLVTRSVNTGSGGENDPTRPLATIIAKPNALEPHSKLAQSPVPLPPATSVWIGKVSPVRTRKLYFSETLEDPNDPNSPTTFYLTNDGETPRAFDPSSDVPNIVTHQGDVEDWIIENRTQELHAFHIHQVHFMLVEWFGLPVNEGFLRDTVNVPYWDGKNPIYPRVKLRMDFRDSNSIGLFPYHCHLLEHEDAGMMGLIRVDPPERKP
jgi:FtsP/CotA-like multicopper oxidase with cupredoxin domain